MERLAAWAQHFARSPIAVLPAVAEDRSHTDADRGQVARTQGMAEGPAVVLGGSRDGTDQHNAVEAAGGCDSNRPWRQLGGSLAI